MKNKLLLCSYLLLRFLLPAAALCPAVGSSAPARDPVFEISPSAGFSIVTNLFLNQPLVLKRRNEILVTTELPPRPTTHIRLPDVGVVNNCNLLRHGDVLFVAHNNSIYNINLRTGQWRVLVEDIGPRRLVGVGSRGELYAVVSTFFGKVPGSSVLSALVSFGPDGKGSVLYQDGGGSVLNDAAWCQDCDCIAVSVTGELVVLSPALGMLHVWTNLGHITELNCLVSDHYVGRQVQASRDRIVAIQKGELREYGRGFSAVSAVRGRIVALEDDKALAVYDDESQRWHTVVGVVGCQNDLCDYSYAAKPALSPTGRYAFTSLACHKQRSGEPSQGFSTEVRSIVIDFEGKSVILLDEYYHQACW